MKASSNSEETDHLDAEADQEESDDSNNNGANWEEPHSDKKLLLPPFSTENHPQKNNERFEDILAGIRALTAPRTTAQASSTRYDLLNEVPEEELEKGGDPQEERDQNCERTHAQFSQEEAEPMHVEAMPHSP